jgi:hypothetical protein
MGGCHLEIRDILLFADCIPTSIYIEYVCTTKTLYTVSREVVRLCESQKKRGGGGAVFRLCKVVDCIWYLLRVCFLALDHITSLVTSQHPAKLYDVLWRSIMMKNEHHMVVTREVLSQNL